MFAPPLPGYAKMLAIDLATNKVVKTIVFSSTTVTPTTYVNDVRFDLRQGKAGFAYLTDSTSTGPGGIIVVDLDNGENWRRLAGHASTSPDPSFIPLVEGERFALREKGKPPIAFNACSDGIAISADGLKLYYCPLSSRHLFSVSTELLRDRSADDTAVAKSVVDLGEKGASDGLESDEKGVSTLETMRTTASGNSRPTANGRRSPTILGSYGLTRYRWRPTGIYISPRTNCIVNLSSMGAPTDGKSHMYFFV